MASSKQLQTQLSQESQQLQADVEASTVYHDPLPNGFCWSVTMPIPEYLERQKSIRGLQTAVYRAREAEQTEIALDQFLHEPE